MDVVLGVIAFARSKGFESVDVAVMISTKHVNTNIESAFALVDVISGVSSEISQFATAFDQHAIFIIPKIASAQPRRTIEFEDMSLRTQFLQAVLDGAAIVQTSFREPHIKMRSEIL